MKKMYIQMHLASQYLAAAGISFLEQKADDSHTNLGFNTDSGCLETHLLSKNNDQLLLCYEDFSLLWKSNDGTTVLKLDGVSHKEVLGWLIETSRKFLNKEYHYQFHYELPYSINEDDVFQLLNISDVRDLLQLRTLTQLSLEKIINTYDFDTEIRIWPHHFDSGIYAKVPNTEISVGLGLAIPDSVCDSYYFYTSGYNNVGQITPTNFKELTKGYWSSTGFKGGVLPAPNVSKQEATQFFKETIKLFLKIAH